MCPIEKGDYAVTLILSVATISLDVWTHAHRSELMVALSRALSVPENIIHMESPRLSEDGLESLEIQTKIRVSDSLFFDHPKEVETAYVRFAPTKAFPTSSLMS